VSQVFLYPTDFLSNHSPLLEVCRWPHPDGDAAFQKDFASAFLKVAPRSLASLFLPISFTPPSLLASDDSPLDSPLPTPCFSFSRRFLSALFQPDSQSFVFFSSRDAPDNDLGVFFFFLPWTRLRTRPLSPRLLLVRSPTQFFCPRPRMFFFFLPGRPP